MFRFGSTIVPEEWLGHFDMLRDFNRNRFYAKAIRAHAPLQCFKEDVDKTLGIDIGCGSGLLCCLVAKILGKKCIAFECIPALAEVAVARENVRRNGLQDLVIVILCHTSDLDADFMWRSFGRRADFCVSELLDSFLLGEGLYDSVHHAKQCLLTDNHSFFIPQRARIYVQAWGGDFFRRGRDLALSLNACGLIAGNKEILCQGPSSGSILQLYTLARRGLVYPVSEAAVAFELDFLSLSSHNKSEIFLSVRDPGEFTAIVMHWESYCDSPDLMSFTTALFDESGNFCPPSADHWKQTIFCQEAITKQLLSEATGCGERNQVKVECFHNTDDFWIGGVRPIAVKRMKLDRSENITRPLCTCALHSCSSLWRIINMNSKQYINFVRSCQYVVSSILDSSEGCNNVLYVLGDSLTIAPAIMLPILQMTSARDDVSSLRVVVLCTSSICARYVEDIMRSNFCDTFINKYVKVATLPLFSSDEKCPDDGEHAIDGDDFKDEDVWIIKLKEVQQGLEEQFQNKLPHQNYFFMEPYIQTLQDEWGLEHFLVLCDLYHTVHSMTTVSLSPLVECCIDNVEIWCAFFSSESLWCEYTAEIAVVEGIDMSAINDLMVEIATSNTEDTSKRLSEWDVKILGSSIIGCLTVHDLVCDSGWKSRHTLSYNRDLNCAEESSCIHGLAFWTVFKSRSNSIALSSHPLDHPETVQSFRCFDKAYDISGCPSTDAVRVDISVKICEKDNSFKVSILSEK